MFSNCDLFPRSQLEHALKETERPLRVTSDCIYKRENRMGIDRVKDDVEGRLYQESSQIVNTQNRLKDQLNSVYLIYKDMFGSGVTDEFCFCRSTNRSTRIATQDTS